MDKMSLTVGDMRHNRVKNIYVTHFAFERRDSLGYCGKRLVTI